MLLNITSLSSFFDYVDPLTLQFSYLRRHCNHSLYIMPPNSASILLLPDEAAIYLSTSKHFLALDFKTLLTVH